MEWQQGEWKKCSVAIKRFHFSGDDNEKLSAFLQEVAVMMYEFPSYFCDGVSLIAFFYFFTRSMKPHPNVVQLAGICNKTPNLCIVSEVGWQYG